MQRKDRPRSDREAQITRGQASSKDGHSTFKKMKVVSRIYGTTKGFAKAKHSFDIEKLVNLKSPTRHHNLSDQHRP